MNVSLSSLSYRSHFTDAHRLNTRKTEFRPHITTSLWLRTAIFKKKKMKWNYFIPTAPNTVYIWPSPAEQLTAGPYLPPGAPILLWFLKQAVVLHEAIFTGFSTVCGAVTGVPVQQLVGGAFRHLRRPTTTEKLQTWSSPTCVTFIGKSCTSCKKRKRIKRPLHTVTSRTCRKSPPPCSSIAQWRCSSAKIVYKETTHISGLRERLRIKSVIRCVS